MTNELTEALRLAIILAEENPCRMGSAIMSMLGQSLRALLSKEYAKGLSQDQVAIYYDVSARTLQRWQKQYKDFPQPRHDGHKHVSYDPVKVIEWKRDHESVFV